MRLCVFEDQQVHGLEPLTLTRPAFDLWCGAATLLDRQRRFFAADEVGATIRPELADLATLTHPDLAINDFDWMRREPVVLVNARWLPPEAALDDLSSPRAGLAQDQIAYVILPPATEPDCDADTIDKWLDDCRQTLPRCDAGGTMIHHLWELVDHNAAMLAQDCNWFRTEAQTTQAPRAETPRSIAVIGPADRLVVDAEATIEPHVVADTRPGPVLIDRGAVVQAFSRLEGPCYIGAETWIVGAKLRGSTIGPGCRIGGEVEASIVHGHSNKYHDGFLGHSYIGEWVNLAAGTQTSDLRNDYGPIKVTITGERIATGRTKVGSFIGDHTKTGLGAFLNTGSAIGAFCNLLPSGTYLPATVPSFCQVRGGQLQERTDLRQIFQTAATVMRRRGCELTSTHVDFFFALFDATAPRRRKLIRDLETRRWRQSV